LSAALPWRELRFARRDKAGLISQQHADLI